MIFIMGKTLLFFDLILKSNEPKMCLFNLYDNWLKNISSYTAFSRLILIFRALHVNPDESKIILKSNSNIITLSHHIWPSLSDEEWINIETQLKDLILNDYSKKNNVNIQSLTQSEIRDIILGAEIQPPSQNEQVINEIDNNSEMNNKNKILNDNSNENISKALTSVTVKTTNIHGQEIIVNVTTPYAQKQFQSKTDWRIRAISASNLYLRCNHIYVNNDDIIESGYTYILPKNILKKFICIADLRTQIGGLIYGNSPKNDNNNIDETIKEIKCIIMPPQIGNYNNVKTPINIPNHKNNIYLNNYQPLGWIHTQSHESNHLNINDIIQHSKYILNNKSWLNNKCIIIIVSFTPGSVTLSSFKLTKKGFEYGKNNQNLINNKKNKNNINNVLIQNNISNIESSYYQKTQMLLSDKFLGFYMIPDQGSWNRNFMGQTFTNNMNYGLILGNPKEYYNQLHRPTHFLKFTNLENNMKNIINLREQQKNRNLNDISPDELNMPNKDDNDHVIDEYEMDRENVFS